MISNQYVTFTDGTCSTNLSEIALRPIINKIYIPFHSISIAMLLHQNYMFYLPLSSVCLSVDFFFASPKADKAAVFTDAKLSFKPLRLMLKLVVQISQYTSVSICKSRFEI